MWQEGIEVAIRYCTHEMAPAGAVKLFGEEVVPVCSPKLMTRARPLARPEDLRHHVLLHYERLDGAPAPWLIWTVWMEVMQIQDFKPAGALRFGQYAQVIRAAIDGQGVALASSGLVKQLTRRRADVRDFIAWLIRQARAEA